MKPGRPQARGAAVPEGRGYPAAGPSDVLDLAPAVPRALCAGDAALRGACSRTRLRARSDRGGDRLPGLRPRNLREEEPQPFASPRCAEVRGGGRKSRPWPVVTWPAPTSPIGWALPGHAPRAGLPLPGCGAAGPGDASSGALGCGHFGHLAKQAAVARCFVGVRWLDTLIVLSPVSCGTVSVVPRHRAEQLYGIGRYRECSRAPEALGQEGSHPRGVPCRGAWGRLLPP